MRRTFRNLAPSGLACVFLGMAGMVAAEDPIALPPGSFWMAPAKASQYGGARDGAVLAVGTAIGPSGMIPVGDRWWRAALRTGRQRMLRKTGSRHCPTCFGDATASSPRRVEHVA